MDMMISSILEEFLAGVSVVLAGLLGVGIRYLFARIKNDKLQSYGDLLADLAEKAVKTVAQTTGDKLKLAAADGKLTDEEKTELKESAVDVLKAIAPDAAMKFMGKVNSDLDELLNTLIESAVHDRNGGDSS